MSDTQIVILIVVLEIIKFGKKKNTWNDKFHKNTIYLVIWVQNTKIVGW